MEPPLGVLCASERPTTYVEFKLAELSSVWTT